MKLTSLGIKLLGRRLLTPVLYGIVLYFFIRPPRPPQHLVLPATAGRLERATRLRPSHWKVFRQFMVFADALLDKLDIWNGRLRLKTSKSGSTRPTCAINCAANAGKCWWARIWATLRYAAHSPSWAKRSP